MVSTPAGADDALQIPPAASGPVPPEGTSSPAEDRATAQPLQDAPDQPGDTESGPAAGSGIAQVLSRVDGRTEHDVDASDDSTVLGAVESGTATAESEPSADGAGGAAEVAPALYLRGLTKQYGDARAVDAVDLTVPVGSFFGLVGPNGAGKTTLLSMISGLLRPTRGRLEVCGVDVRTRPRRAKQLLGVLPDQVRTFDRLTGRQLLHYYGVLRKLKPAVVEERSRELAAALDLESSMGRQVSDYSVGMTKKIMLAGALIHAPRVLILDEPFEAVDPMSSQVIIDILRGFVERGGTVVLSSHGIDLIERVCDRVAIVSGGRIAAEGTVQQVREGHSLEDRYEALTGLSGDLEGLEWLHTSLS